MKKRISLSIIMVFLIITTVFLFSPEFVFAVNDIRPSEWGFWGTDLMSVDNGNASDNYGYYFRIDDSYTNNNWSDTANDFNSSLPTIYPADTTQDFMVHYTMDFSVKDRARINKGDLTLASVGGLAYGNAGGYDDKVGLQVTAIVGGSEVQIVNKLEVPASQGAEWYFSDVQIPQGTTSLVIACLSQKHSEGLNDAGFEYLSVKIADTNGPTIDQIYSNISNDTRGIGETVSIYVKFDESVVVTGSPTIGLNSGGTATYNSGSGTDTLRFDYTVVGSHKTPEGEVLSYDANAEITLGSGVTIKDPAGNSASVSLAAATNTLANTNNIKIDGIYPTVTDIQVYNKENNAVQNSNTYLSAASGDKIYIKLYLSEPVSVIGTPQLYLNNGQEATFTGTESYNYVNNSVLRFEYVVQSTHSSRNKDTESLNIDFSKTGTTYLDYGTIEDAGGNDLNRSLSGFSTTISNKCIGIDNTKPNIIFGDNDGTDWAQSHYINVDVLDSHSGIQGSEFKYHWSTSSTPPDWSTITTKHPDGTAIRMDKSGVNGQYYLHINAIDEEGNENTISTSFARKFDNIDPRVIFGENGSTSPSASYWFYCTISDYSPSASSGIDESKFRHQWVKEGDLVNENAGAWSNDYLISFGIGGEDKFQVNSDPGSGSANGYPISHGNWKLVVEAVDNAGNSKRYETGFFHVDMTPPTLSTSDILTNPSNAEGYEKAYDITINAVDENNVPNDKDYPNGTVQIYYQWTDSNIAPTDLSDFTGWSLYTEPLSQGTVNGQKWLHVKAKDNSQNISQGINKRFTFDNEGPIVNFDPANNGSNGCEDIKQSAAIDIEISDVFSNVDNSSIQYQWARTVQAGDTEGGNIWYKQLGEGTQLLIDDGNWTSDNSLSYTTSTLSFTDGDWYLVVKARDDKGTESISASDRFRLASYPVTGSMNIVPNYTITTTVDITLNATDMNAGEALQYMWVDSSGNSVNGNQWIGFANGDTVEGAIPNSEGERIIYLKYRDSLGNVSPVYSDTVTLDITDPTAVTAYSETNWTNNDVIVTLTPSDNYTPIENIVVAPAINENVVANGGNNEYRILQNGSYEFTLEDLAGNQAPLTVEVSNIDKEGPSINITNTDESFIETEPYQSVSAVINSIDNRALENELDVYYQWSLLSDSSLLNELNWISITNGDIVSLDSVTGDYYLYVKAVEHLEVIGEKNTTISNGEKFILDNTPPTPTITYTETTRTANPVKATITFDEIATITTPTDGTNYNIFEDNGQFTFEYVDRAENTGSAIAAVDWIDTTIPNAQITLSTTELTNGNVIVTIDATGEPQRELLNFNKPADLDAVCIDTQTQDGRLVIAAYELRENGSFSFEVRDIVTGVIDEVTAYVDNIDKEAPTADISYSTTEPTQNNVIVYVDAYDNSNRPVEVIPPNNATIRNQINRVGYEFTDNGQYTFTLRDAFGNTSTITASIKNIDRMAPMGSIWYMSDKWTNQPVKATLTAFEDVEVVNNDGERVYEFTENGTFTFMIEDRAGNTNEILAEVDWIDLELPTAEVIETDIYRMDRESEELVKVDEEEIEIEYDAEKGLKVLGSKTNQYVEVVIEIQDNMEEEVKVIAPYRVSMEEIDEAIKLTFTKNGEYDIQVEDIAGNITFIPIIIENIDKEPPEVEVIISEFEPTNKDVIVSFKANEEIVVIPPVEAVVDEKLNTTNYIFSHNGIYEFIIEDLAGNTVTKEIKIINIDKIPPTGRVVYSNLNPTRESVIATVKANEDFQVLNNFNLTQKEFFKNGSYTFTIQDLAGNIVDVQAEVNNIDNEPPNVIVQYSNTEYTNQNITAALFSDEEFVVLNNNGKQVFEFEKNGTFVFKIVDMLGNERYVHTSVDNIDKDKPILAFDLNRTPVFLQNEEYILDDFVAYDEIDGDITNRVQVDYNGFDISQPGTFYVKYSVSDNAGNITMVTRKAVVISPDSYRVFANGLDPNFETLIFDNPKIIFDIINSQGDITIRWKQKKSTKGELKSRANMLYHNEFLAERTGWYTFYIQDQERNGQLIQVYITSTNE